MIIEFVFSNVFFAIFLISSNSFDSAKTTSGIPLRFLRLISILAIPSISSIEYNDKSFFALFTEIFPAFNDSKISCISNDEFSMLV